MAGCSRQTQVPSEEVIREIRDRYLDYNWHASSYTWKVLLPKDGDHAFTVLDLDKTLEENGRTSHARSLSLAPSREHRVRSAPLPPSPLLFWRLSHPPHPSPESHGVQCSSLLRAAAERPEAVRKARRPLVCAVSHPRAPCERDRESERSRAERTALGAGCTRACDAQRASSSWQSLTPRGVS